VIAEAVLDLQPLLRARSIAVIGISEDPTKLGSRVLHNVLRNGFSGPVYGVGRCQEAQGVACFPNPLQLPQPVDVAFLALPASAVLAAAEQCAARGVRALAIGAAGFAEEGDPEGAARQAELVELCRRTGLILLGPNCNGFYSPHHRLSLGFNSAHAEAITPGNVAILSHSGALFESMWRRLDSLGVGLSCFVSLGNEATTDVLDVMDDQVAQAETKVIGLLIDALPDGMRFAGLAQRAAEAGKSVVVLKLGRSTVGSDAATAHSSRLVGDEAAYDALFRAWGVATARTLEGFVTALGLLSRFGQQAGGLAAISTSGAGGALIADVADRHGVPFAKYGEGVRNRLAPLIRFSDLANPTDLGVFAGVPAYGEIVPAIADDPRVGAMLFQTHAVHGQATKLFGALRESQARTRKPHILLAPGGLPQADVAAAMEAGLVLLTETDTAIQALGAVLAPRATPAALAQVPQPLAPPGARSVSEQQSLELLAGFGIRVVPAIACDDLEACAAAAECLGWPIVLKSAAEGVSHKSDFGLVRVGVADLRDLRAAYADMGAPPRLLVQPVIRGDLEIILGVSYQAGSGFTLVAGLGGVFAEALQLTTKWALPVSQMELYRGLKASALGRILTSPRWRIPGTMEAVVLALAGLQDFAAAAGAWLEAVDINPLIATADGLIAVDALVVSRRMSHAGAW